VKVLVVDDEPLARERLQRLLTEIAGVEYVGEAANGLEALRRIAALRPDVVLLDIRMPGMDGLETARHLARLDVGPAVIFVTAFGDYALQAFEARAVDYVMKPVRVERLTQALERARRLSASQMDAVSAAASGPQPRARTHLSAHVHGELRIIPVADVLFFQADQKYVTVRHREGEVLIEESLKGLEEEFGDAFVRIHRNALVARRALEAMETGNDGQVYVRLRGVAEKLEVSRRHTPDLRQLLRSGRV
jgi:two-component system response regulator AlgR